MIDLLKTVFDVTEIPLDKRLKVLEEFYVGEKYMFDLCVRLWRVREGLSITI